MRAFFILVAGTLLSGCVTTIPPLSVEELREDSRKGPSGIKITEYEIMRSFPQAYSAVQINAERCFEVTVTMPPSNNSGAGVKPVRYRTESLMTSETTSETSMQLDKKSFNPMPEGGYYILLADIEAISSVKSRLTIYGVLNGYENVHESIIAWAQGRNDDCPQFPVGALDTTLTHHNP
jgi:hypothetical protein